MIFLGLITMWVCYIVRTILSAIDQEQNFENGGLSIGILAMIYIYGTSQGFVVVIGTPYIMEISPFSLRASTSIPAYWEHSRACSTIMLTQSQW